ncbi:MAG: AMP-binding protein, partial [Pseudomonadales bacterium]
EIFGSTETGVVAWRHQQIDAVWQVFDGIQCRCNGDGQLQLRSPALPDDGWFVSADKIQLKGENRFELRGRVDKVVKVAGKRISLTEVERLLAAHPWVREVRVLPHFHRSSRLCAVVSLNPQGNAYLVDKGARSTGKKLCEALAGAVERVAYPRYWRYVAHLPVNQQGKTTAQELTALFQPHERITEPTIIASNFNAERNEYRAELVIPENLFYLEGHFPGQPVLPGVVQLAWVVKKGRELFGPLGEFEKMEAIKFQQVIRAGERLNLRLLLDSAKNSLVFSYETNDRKVSSGRIVFRSGPADGV